MIALVIKILGLFFLAWVALVVALYIISGVVRLLGEFAKWFFALAYFARVSIIAILVSIITLGALAS